MPIRTSNETPKIVNLGSLCFDRVYQVPAFVRAGETLRASSLALFPGGKGLNQSLAARRAGADVVHVGCIGSDGEALRAVLRDAGVQVDGIRMQSDIATAHAVIQVAADGNNAIVIIAGSNFAISPQDVDVALGALAAGDWLLLQNEINDVDSCLRAATARAGQVGARVCLNLAPCSEAADRYPLERVDLLVVNENEAEGLTGSANPKLALAALRRRCPHSTLVLTQGEHGLLFDAHAGVQRLPAFSVHTVDGTGAGDAFIGYLLAALQRDVDLPRALRTASAAGALAATRAGAATSIPEQTEVAQMLARIGATELQTARG